MSYVTGISRNQMMLPYCLEDLIAEDSPVRIIDAFVDQLDLLSLGFTHTQQTSTGRPAYAPGLLLKLYLYGYFNHIRSSRRLMTECRRNVELFFLLQHLVPDFRTIADFRKNNAKAMKGVFKAFVQLCLSCELYSKELLAIDGSKFRAVNGNKKMYNREILDSKLRHISEHLNDYLSELDHADLLETEEEQALTHQNLLERIKELEERKLQYEGYLKELEQSGETQLCSTDPEARMMQSRNGFHCCYNVQTAVDSDSHLIAGYQVTNHPNDQQLLNRFTSELKEELETEILSVVADKGYDSQSEILSCIENGVIPYVGFRFDNKERLCVLPYEPTPAAEQLRDSTSPEDLCTCMKAGVLPTCYEGTNLSIEVQGDRFIGCFHRDTGGRTVTCPMGYTLTKIRERHGGTEYACKTACRQCTNRCTASKAHKVVRFGPGTEYVAARMYGEQEPIIHQPAGFTPNNSFYRKNTAPRLVLLRIADDKPKQRLRLCLSEHPFGTVKWSHGAYYLLCKGIKKATAELGLSFTVYNLKRAINLMGVPALLEAIGRQ